MGKAMKRLQIIVLLLFLSAPSFAQDKIAVINSDAFYDEKTGITELVFAQKKLETEFSQVQEELRSLNKRLEEIVIENQRHPPRNKSISEVVKKSEEQWQEAQRLSGKMKLIIDEVKPQIEKRRFELIEPVNKRIAEKLKVFAKQKDFTSIFESSKSEDLEESGCVCYQGVCIIYADYPDVTNEFIKFCNEEFEKERLPKR